MRKNLLIIFTLAIIAITTSSCDKDCDTSQSTYYTVDGVRHEAKFVVASESDGQGGYMTGIILFGDGITLVDGDFSGIGNTVILWVFHTAADMGATYTWSEDDGPNSFYGDWGESENGEIAFGSYWRFSGGSITAFKTGDNYKATFDVTDSEGRRIKGEVNGKPAAFVEPR